MHNCAIHSTPMSIISNEKYDESDQKGQLDMRTSALLDMFSYKFFTPYLQIRLAIDISNFSKLYHRIPHLGSCFDNIKRDLNSGFESILQCLLTSEIPHKNNNNIAVIGPKFIPKKHAASFSLLVRAVARSTGVIRHQQRHFKSH